MCDLIPIFLISLPRSGSTLLQKILTVNPEIHSVTEPWFILPLAYSFRKEGILTIYSQKNASLAIKDFIGTFPNNNKDYFDELRKFIISLYLKTRPNMSVKYFLDKTPRYYLIISFLAEVFPQAKFIFLFRNPLEVLSSIIKTWTGDRLFIYRHYIDLYYGPQAIANGFTLLKDRSVSINYSDLVNTPEKEIKNICSYLQIKYDQSMLSQYQTIKFSGRMGDQSVLNENDTISTIPKEKWKSSLNTIYRKYFSKKYIKGLGDDTLSAFGTSVKELHQEINSITNLRGGSFQDFFFHIVSLSKILINIDYYKNLGTLFFKKERFYPYT